jgi:hypothetical protein
MHAGRQAGQEQEQGIAKMIIGAAKQLRRFETHSVMLDFIQLRPQAAAGSRGRILLCKSVSQSVSQLVCAKFEGVGALE